MTVHFSDKYFAMTENEEKDYFSSAWVDHPHDDISDNLHEWISYPHQNQHPTTQNSFK